MIDVKTLSIKEKVNLLNKLYEDISGLGIGGDTELAHVNPWEADLLRSVGGAGTLNGVTGLPQYMGGGGSKPAPAPATTTTKNVPEYAPEQREYVSDVFGKAQELYEQRSQEGFQPFSGAQLAPFAAQEQEAFGGIESLARGPGAAPAFDIARNAALGAAAPITAGEVQQGMNPYQQAVTDIGKREAVRQYQRGPQAQIRTGAVDAGGLRGARRFIEEGEGQRNLNQQLADLQTMGSQQAFQQSMAEAAAARGRLANLATQMPSIGMGAYNQQMQQLGQLGGVGEAYRSREQAAIDLAQNQFQREQMFPEETLATYLRFITNAPSPSGFQRTTQAPGIAGPGTLQQLAGLGISGAATGKAFGLFSRGGAVSGRQAGLSGIVRRAGGGQIVRMKDGRSIAQKYAEAYGYPEPGSTPYEPIEILTPPLTMSDFPAAGAASVVTAKQGQEIAVRRLMEDIAKGSVQGGDIYPDMPDLLEEKTDVQTPAPPPKKPTPTDQVAKDIETLNTRTLSEPKPETGTISDAGYLDIAAAALAGMSATDPAGTPQTTLGQLSKVLSPAASAAASGMRDAKKTAREQQLLDMSITKETREATSAGVVDKLRQMQTETERLKPGTDKAAARAKYIQGIGQLVREYVLDPEEARALLMPYLNTSTARSGGSNDGSLAQGRTRDLGRR